MPIIIVLLFIGIPMLELSVLIDVGTEIGVLGVVALTILTAIIGLSLVRHQGLKVMRDMQEATRSGQPAGAALVHGFFIAVAGILLFLPGFVTDAIGALFLVPPIRSLLGTFIISRMAVKMHHQHTHSYQKHQREDESVIIETEFWQDDAPAPRVTNGQQDEDKDKDN